MQNQSTLSTNKIVILLVFLCVAIMSSLFVFHMSHKQVTTIIPAEKGTIFTATREIKPFELVSAEDKLFTQKDFLNHWTLLFFGFTHCSNVCPATLEMISRVYDKLHASYPNLQVVLVSLDPKRDSIEALAKYTHGFHPDFIGVSGKIQELRKLQSQLGVYSSQESNASDNYQIQHSSSILLINPKGKWAGMFTYGMKPNEFAQMFEIGVKSLNDV